ncbi:SixA phosphatase family protein [Sulfurimonas microaerophilic]|uniref:SixA phosphatase family protein n=1 Tax=Sulfurimonas microaerophilic TaxID=3058392 RepID=UPI002714C42C|nr:histidine phosphatase family protein [Sulfurimonas sp. hsl 1-7]
MKTVILIRHAKSSWKDLLLADFDRPLNKRGKRDAPVMACHLKKQGIAIEKIFASSAKRAKKTAEIFNEKLQTEVDFYDELYATSSEKLLAFINKQLKQYDSIAIVSHNPELTELSNHISDQYISNIPTSAYVVLKCNEDRLAKNNCELIDFVYPKREDIALYK